MGTLTDLSCFLRDRWDEKERESALFHELDCSGPADGHYAVCRCPCPRRLFESIETHRRILKSCLDDVEGERQSACWPLNSVLAFHSMKALALPYELHPAWRDVWYP